MNGDSLLALSASESLGMATGGLRPSPQSRHPQERPSHKASPAFKENRQHGYDGHHQQPTQYPHTEHRSNLSHRSGNISRSNQGRSNFAPISSNYHHPDYAPQGSHVGLPRPTHRHNQGHSPTNQRKYTTSSNGTQQPSARHRHSSPNISPHNTYSHSHQHVMSRSSSFGSTTQRNFGYDGQLGNRSINMATPRHDHHFSETAPQAHVKHSRLTSDQVNDDASVPSQILSSSAVPGPSDIVLPHQPMYAVPWMMMPMPIMLPPHYHPQVMNPERQELPNMDHTNNVRPVFEESANLDRRPVASSEQEHGRDRLREQLEWYLSPRNLSTDVYLVSKMNNEHWVPITILAEFRKVKELTGSLQEVVDALRRSPVVIVDETGMMVKPITVDRPRTTLLLRELPEDTTQEEIASVFVEAGCIAKSITKEVVGNMWFVEFDTAADALAMHNYTRGRCIKGVPIAARIKSTTVLTGGEYKATQSTPTAMSVTSVSMAIPSPKSGRMASPLSPTFDPAAMAMSMPYRRFPASESSATQEWGPETNKAPDTVHGYSTSVYPAASYSAGSFYPPVLMGPPTHSANNDGYYYTGHRAWTAVGGDGTLSPEGRPLPENLQPMFADPSFPQEALQHNDNSAMGPRRSSYPLFPLQVFHEKFSEPGAKKNNQRRRQQYGSMRKGQLHRQAQYQRDHQQTPQQNHLQEHGHGLMHPSRFYPVQNSSSMQHDRSDRSSDAKSDSFSSRVSGSASSERKSKKSKSKKNKADRQSKEPLANEDLSIKNQAAGNISGSASVPDLRSREPAQESKEQYQNQIGRLTTKVSNVSMADHPGAARSKRKGSTAQAVKPAQPSPSLESDSFPHCRPMLARTKATRLVTR
ncbi:unnamed protein product [Mortierella alpina]